MIGRLAAASSMIFFATFLGMIMFVLTLVYAPDFLRWLQNGAGYLEDMLTHDALPVRFTTVADTLLDDGAITLLFYAVFARMLIFLVISGIRALLGGGRDEPTDYPV